MEKFVIFRIVAVACVCIPLLASSASAQSQSTRRRRPTTTAPAAADPTPAPETTPAAPAPVPDPAPASSPEASPPQTHGPAAAPAPARAGAFVEGGLWLTAGGSTNPFLRIEGGFPLGARLSLILPLAYGPDRIDVPGYLETHQTLLFMPGVRYSYPLYSGKGSLAAYGEGNVGGGMVHTKIDDFGGQTTSTDWLGVVRIGAGVSYTAPFGLTALVQPLGLSVFFDDSGARARYDFAVMVGYRGR